MNRRDYQSDEISELLSAYVDDELDRVERSNVEALLRSNPAYAEEVEELRLLKSWLHDLPAPQPKRSFTIDPTTAPRPRWQLFSTLRWATVAAAMLLMLTIGVDAFGGVNGGMGGGAATGAAPAAQEQSDTFRSLEDPAAAASPAASQPEANALTAPGVEEAAPAPQASPEGEGAVQEQAPAEEGEAPPAPEEQPDAGTAPDAGEAYPAPEEQMEAEASPAPEAEEELAAEASPAGEDEATGAAPERDGAMQSPLASSETTAADTVEAVPAAAPEPAPFTTLQIVQLVLLLTTVALGAGTWFAWRRHL